MSGPSCWNPTGRFTGLAGLYAQYRPTYPDAALDTILRHCSLGPGSLLVDLGCGTGISSRQFALRGVRVIGIEPNADMRVQAELENLPPGVMPPVYKDGRAEATGLPDAGADAVLAAQAFHWFEPDRALREFHRILKRGGWTVLMWNERDESDSFTAAYGQVIRSAPDAAAVEVPRSQAGAALRACPLFKKVQCLHFGQAQIVDQEALLGRAFSTSYAPREREAAEAFATALRTIFANFQQRGRVILRYNTTVYVGHRSSTDALL